MVPRESDFLRWLYTQERSSETVRIPIGDDLASIKWGDDLLLVGIDQVLDGVHFKLDEHPPRAIGAKAMNRNLSDCAAMACLPAAAVASVALPRGIDLETIKEIYLGMKAAAAVFDCPIVGGDTSAWNGPLAISVAILGKSGGVEPITRSGAKVGDHIFVTGSLGGSIAGRHLNIVPRVALARELARTQKISAMIDISDGLSRDLEQICTASGVSAMIHASAIPIHSDAVSQSAKDKVPPIEHALHDGEDHELLFTTPTASEIIGCVRVGQIIPVKASAARVQIEIDGETRSIIARGWDAKF